MTKKCLVSLIGTIIFALSLGFASATIPFEDNFENYTPGESLAGQGLWIPPAGTDSSVWFVNDDTAFTKTGARSIYYSPEIELDPEKTYSAVVERTGATTTNATLQFFYKFFGTCNNNSDFAFYLTKNPDFSGGFCATYNATTSQYIRYDRFSDSSWHKAQMDFNYEVAGEVCRWRIDSEDWTTYEPSTFPHYVGTLAFELAAGNLPANCYIFIDDISYRSSQGATIIPISPPDCQASTGINFNPLEVSGKIEIPINSKRTFTNLIVRFQEATTTISLYDWSFALPSLIAGQTYNYFATGTIPTSTYRVSYILSGYDENLQPFTQSEICPGTFACGTNCVPEIVSELPDYGQPTFDECGALSGTEKWLCEIKNVIAGVFIPSTSTLGELKSNIDLLQNKAPMNYLRESQDFFTDLKNQSSTTNSLTLTILGNTGDVSFAFWEKTGEISGVQFSFRTIFYNVFCFVVIVIFGFWAISYMRKIFK